ncbi:MAG: ATP synthase F1 subunit delta [Lentisphaerae bacterium]|nr:ATP synthase F1 subunit delta [Lentisphaerota bacterium]
MSSAAEARAQYAAALVALGRASGAPERIGKELGMVADWLAGSDDLKRFLSDPRVREEGKRAALEELLAGKVGRLLADFVLLLAGQGAAHMLPEIAGEFFAATAALHGEIAGELVSARELDPARVAAVEEQIGRLIGGKVRLAPRVDPDSLGGIRVTVGSLVFDATIEHQLDQIRRGLTAA